MAVLESKHNIDVFCLQVYVTDKHLAIVMEYASGGTLGQRIDETGPFPEEKAKELFLQLIAGMDYCHGLGYDLALPCVTFFTADEIPEPHVNQHLLHGMASQRST